LENIAEEIELGRATGAKSDPSPYLRHLLKWFINRISVQRSARIRGGRAIRSSAGSVEPSLRDYPPVV
jgi:hypothetical protein